MCLQMFPTTPPPHPKGTTHKKQNNGPSWAYRWPILASFGPRLDLLGTLMGPACAPRVLLNLYIHIYVHILILKAPSAFVSSGLKFRPAFSRLFGRMPKSGILMPDFQHSYRCPVWAFLYHRAGETVPGETVARRNGIPAKWSYSNVGSIIGPNMGSW